MLTLSLRARPLSNFLQTIFAGTVILSKAKDLLFPCQPGGLHGKGKCSTASCPQAPQSAFL